ncbi:hypothetical protein [Oscillibacter sp.]|uniref:hypothetical protein n=1 Tax=Oscillibacter sp. TaxID=1945593 RepID=UPI0028986452|nr:hypothetical protein [Oscillibacter sp.]
MSDYLNEEYCVFDNDASASSFGWNFQSNAGIFLFLKYIQQAEDIKIESKLQDIEITLLDGNKVFAQAKSSQDFTVAKDTKEKFKDAIVSLARNKQDGNKLVYISNVPDTFKSATGVFNNSVVPYTDCLSGIKDEIDKAIQSTIASIEKKLAAETKQEKRRRIQIAKEMVENFDKSTLYISTIHPYWGNEENRYQSISDAVLSFLVDDIKLSRDDAISIKQRLLEHWQLRFEHNSTIKDTESQKKLKKSDFVWPVAAFLIDNELSEIYDCLTFTPDKCITNEVKRILESSECFYHERFEFSNSVLQEFNQFKKENRLDAVEKVFIKSHYNLFLNEFSNIEDLEEREYITKAFMFRIICNYKNLQRIGKGAGMKI